MKILDINKNDLFHFLINKNCIGQGTIGIVSEYDDNTLIKIYYKELIDTYVSEDINKLDEEIDTKIEVMKKMEEFKSLIAKENDKEIEKLNERKNKLLESMGYLKGIVYYHGIKVGVLINYYKEYKKLCNIYSYLNEESKIYLLKKIKEKLNNLISNNLYPTDLKEDNILINIETLDISFIDLDDLYTRYEEQEYIKLHNLNLEDKCHRKYSEMTRRLEINR